MTTRLVQFIRFMICKSEKLYYLCYQRLDTMNLLRSIIIAGFAFFTAISPVQADIPAENDVAAAQTEVQDVKIYTKGARVRVVGAAKQHMLVYSLAGGNPVLSLRVDSEDKSFLLNLQKGIYIVKVGKAVRKITL